MATMARGERKTLPSRRRQWTQKAKIGGQTVYLCCGEHADHALGEVFLDASKTGTFVRGILGALGRVISLAIQCGTPVEEVVKVMRDLDFPPNGDAIGSDAGAVKSVVDWAAREIEHEYILAPQTVPPAPEKVAGFESTGNAW